MNLTDQEWLSCMCKVEFITNKDLAAALQALAEDRAYIIKTDGDLTAEERMQLLDEVVTLIAASARLEETPDSERVTLANAEKAT